MALKAIPMITVILCMYITYTYVVKEFALFEGASSMSDHGTETTCTRSYNPTD